MVRQETKDAVIAEIANVAYQAIKKGNNPRKVVDRTFPDVPLMVKVEAMTLAEMQSDDDWWEQVEKTIDGEIVRNAISGRAA